MRSAKKLRKEVQQQKSQEFAEKGLLFYPDENPHKIFIFDPEEFRLHIEKWKKEEIAANIRNIRDELREIRTKQISSKTPPTSPKIKTPNTNATKASTNEIDPRRIFKEYVNDYARDILNDNVTFGDKRAFTSLSHLESVIQTFESLETRGERLNEEELEIKEIAKKEIAAAKARDTAATEGVNKAIKEAQESINKLESELKKLDELEKIQKEESKKQKTIEKKKTDPKKIEEFNKSQESEVKKLQEQKKRKMDLKDVYTKKIQELKETQKPEVKKLQEEKEKIRKIIDLNIIEKSLGHNFTTIESDDFFYLLVGNVLSLAKLAHIVFSERSLIKSEIIEKCLAKLDSGVPQRTEQSTEEKKDTYQEQSNESKKRSLKDRYFISKTVFHLNWTREKDKIFCLVTLNVYSIKRNSVHFTLISEAENTFGEYDPETTKEHDPEKSKDSPLPIIAQFKLKLEPIKDGQSWNLAVIAIQAASYTKELDFECDKVIKQVNFLDGLKNYFLEKLEIFKDKFPENKENSVSSLVGPIPENHFGEIDALMNPPISRRRSYRAWKSELNHRSNTPEKFVLELFNDHVKFIYGNGKEYTGKEIFPKYHGQLFPVGLAQIFYNFLSSHLFQQTHMVYVDKVEGQKELPAEIQNIAESEVIDIGLAKAGVTHQIMQREAIFIAANGCDAMVGFVFNQINDAIQLDAEYFKEKTGKEYVRVSSRVEGNGASDSDVSDSESNAESSDSECSDNENLESKKERAKQKKRRSQAYQNVPIEFSRAPEHFTSQVTWENKKGTILCHVDISFAIFLVNAEEEKKGKKENKDNNNEQNGEKWAIINSEKDADLRPITAQETQQQQFQPLLTCEAVFELTVDEFGTVFANPITYHETCYTNRLVRKYQTTNKELSDCEDNGSSSSFGLLPPSFRSLEDLKLLAVKPLNKDEQIKWDEDIKQLKAEYEAQKKAEKDAKKRKKEEACCWPFFSKHVAEKKSTQETAPLLQGKGNQHYVAINSSPEEDAQAEKEKKSEEDTRPFIPRMWR